MYKDYFTVNKLKNSQISYGFFSKQSGLSKKNYDSVYYNSSNNDKTHFKKQIELAKKKLNLEHCNLKLLNQTHSNKVVSINKNNVFDNFKADGSITKDKFIALAVLTADCAPIFIYDKDSSFVCCLHSGWKGCLTNIIKFSLKQIIRIQPDTSKVYAIVGPCLHKKNFEVDFNFKNQFLATNPKYNCFFFDIPKKNKYFFDMRSLINYQFKSLGIKNIHNVNLDTYDNEKKFFSHRRSTHLNSLPTGRMLNIIGFNKKIS